MRVTLALALFVAAALPGPATGQTPPAAVAAAEPREPADDPLLLALIERPAETLVPDDAVELAMEIDASGRPIVEVRIDGAGPFRFGIDWGANHVVVSEAVAREAALPIEGRIEPPGMPDRDIARIGEIAIGGVRIRDMRATVGGFLDTTVDGILGFNALMEIPVTLDFPAAEVRIGGPGLGAPDGERILALVPYEVGSRPAITIRLGEFETVAWLDTRSPLPLILPVTLRDRFTAAGEVQRARARGPQTGDMELEIVPLAESLVLGSHVVEEPLVAFRSLPDADPGLRLFDEVILGGPLLRQFAITLDLAAGAVRLDRAATGPIRLPAPQPRPAGS